ncbi:MAG TPA: hypothetical protein ENN76_00590 [Euryarchaeota archaeon]|nr:hypothetical protein [Euryarchaeota archaeon]
MGFLEAIIFFLVGLLVSTLIIFVITKLFHEKEGFGTALYTALTGSFIYALVYYILGTGLLAALIAGLVWTGALMFFYSMRWWKAVVVAIVVWIVAFFVGILLPTLMGPF